MCVCVCVHPLAPLRIAEEATPTAAASILPNQSLALRPQRSSKAAKSNSCTVSIHAIPDTNDRDARVIGRAHPRHGAALNEPRRQDVEGEEVQQPFFHGWKRASGAWRGCVCQPPAHYRSTSPNTGSSDPIITTRSAIKFPGAMPLSACRLYMLRRTRAHPIRTVFAVAHDVVAELAARPSTA